MTDKSRDLYIEADASDPCNNLGDALIVEFDEHRKGVCHPRRKSIMVAIDSDGAAESMQDRPSVYLTRAQSARLHLWLCDRLAEWENYGGER